MGIQITIISYLSQNMRFPTMWYVRPAKAQASLHPEHMRSLIRAFASHLIILWVLSYCPNFIWSL